MKRNKKDRIPPTMDSYLVSVDVSMLIPSTKNKQDAIYKTIKALEECKYVIEKNLVSTNLYE